MTYFVDKLKALTPKEMILTMVQAIRNPCYWMRDYDEEPCYKRREMFFGHTWDLYGQVATNMEYIISGVKFTTENISYPEKRAIALGTTQMFLERFEAAIECLRKGLIQDYNFLVVDIDLAQIAYYPTVNYPMLNESTKEDFLQMYEKLSEEQMS